MESKRGKRLLQTLPTSRLKYERRKEGKGLGHDFDLYMLQFSPFTVSIFS
jgi:hypothetical protein